ncbi:hypothetical protein MNQ98_07735 [Paenibacillus sp. N3/727]|uniref:hypothetical protein n=1 Tax=Paenibacillus sp. N3/727 TaxID=2925845 RepID=UPI001F532A12|nr:hypothetical protein [Paenibacillus sp. N3/727]UNK19896.1 hypothetical protein MNQ98_07735 [Paenibacillus sp. N3/727]
MKESEEWDHLLKNALVSEKEPEEILNQAIIRKYKERGRMRHAKRKKLTVGIVVASVTLALSMTAFAAAQLFNANQVAEHLKETKLAQAFDSRDAIEVNQSADAKDYRFTLHGIVSGAGLKELANGAEGFNADRTYAVVSIARQDGSAIPSTADPEYGKEAFFVSPLIKGQKPWAVNIVTMNGGYSEFVADGIMYRLIECDDIEMFADRGVYLAIASGTSFYSNDAFVFQENTGSILPKADYEGAALLFDLPLDPTKADRAKADAYLRELTDEPATSSAIPSDKTESELADEIEDMKRKIPEGTLIPESVIEVTLKEGGNIFYEYNDWSVTIPLQQLFLEGQTGYSESVHFSGDGAEYKALQFYRDEKGFITGRITILP